MQLLMRQDTMLCARACGQHYDAAVYNEDLQLHTRMATAWSWGRCGIAMKVHTKALAVATNCTHSMLGQSAVRTHLTNGTANLMQKLSGSCAKQLF